MPRKALTSQSLYQLIETHQSSDNVAWNKECRCGSIKTREKSIVLAISEYFKPSYNVQSPSGVFQDVYRSGVQWILSHSNAWLIRSVPIEMIFSSLILGSWKRRTEYSFFEEPKYMYYQRMRAIVFPSFIFSSDRSSLCYDALWFIRKCDYSISVAMFSPWIGLTILRSWLCPLPIKQQYMVISPFSNPLEVVGSPALWWWSWYRKTYHTYFHFLWLYNFVPAKNRHSDISSSCESS